MECRYPFHDHKPSFDFSQASLVFINACFGLAFASMFITFAKFLETNKYYLLLWGILPSYLIFIVWRQYHTYYIPLQYYRGSHETVVEEFSTFLTTATLGLLGVSAAVSPRLTIFFLFIVIALNLVKIRQMRQALQVAPNRQSIAINEVDDLLRRTLFNLCLTVIVFLPLLVSISILESHPVILGALGGVLPVILHYFFVPKAYTLIYSQHKPNSAAFIEAVSISWICRS